MKNLKTITKLVFIALVTMLPLMFISCDTDECFEDTHYKSQTVQKALPGATTRTDSDC